MRNGVSDHCLVLSHEADIDALIAESFRRPVVLLKHSEWCNRSHAAIDVARRELGSWGKQIDCRIVIVQQHRAVAAAIARRLDIRHETPQIILLRDGQATWDAAHTDITAKAVKRALQLAMEADAPDTETS